MRKVTFPQEIELWYVMPAIRKEIALALIKKGLSQKEVAKTLSVTEATISHYKKEKRATINLFEKVSSLKEQVDLSVNKILDNQSLLTTELLRLNKLVKQSGFVCQLYANNTSLEADDRPCNSCSHSKNSNQNNQINALKQSDPQPPRTC